MFLIRLFLLISVGVFCKASIQESENEPLNLTPLVEKGLTAEARKLSAVDPKVFSGVKSHAAFFNVNKLNKWNTFFSFFPAPNKPLETTPWVIWLQGDPVFSSMFGLFEEIGPIVIVNGTVEESFSLGSNYSLLFIDNPVGMGFSYVEGEVYPASMDEVSAALLSFLQQFLEVFPELRKAPLFIAGESLAGKYILTFAHHIHHNYRQRINLKGLAIGSGLIDPISHLHYSEFLPQIGLVDVEQAEQIRKVEIEARKYCQGGDTVNCRRLFANVGDLIEEFTHVDIHNYLELDDIMDREYEMLEFLNRTDVRSALHVGELSFVDYNEDALKFLADSYGHSFKPYLEELLEHYGVICYSGQLDMLAAYPMAVQLYRSLKWSGAQAYREAKRTPIKMSPEVGPDPVDPEFSPDLVVGYLKGSGNFMEVLVRTAGHMVAAYQPAAVVHIMSMFIEKFAK